MHVMIGSTCIQHSSETCQYNSNVLTLVAVTCYVAGLFDISEVGLQVYNQHVCLWHFEDEGPHAYRYSAAMKCNSQMSYVRCNKLCYSWL